jgi:hypothetical protein
MHSILELLVASTFSEFMSCIAWHSQSSMAIYASVLIDAGMLGIIYLVVLMLAINRSKVIQFRDRITPDLLAPFLSIVGHTSPCSSFINTAAC